MGYCTVYSSLGLVFLFSLNIMLLRFTCVYSCGRSFLLMLYNLLYEYLYFILLMSIVIGCKTITAADVVFTMSQTLFLLLCIYYSFKPYKNLVRQVQFYSHFSDDVTEARWVKSLAQGVTDIQQLGPGFKSRLSLVGSYCFGFWKYRQYLCLFRLLNIKNDTCLKTVFFTVFFFKVLIVRKNVIIFALFDFNLRDEMMFGMYFKLQQAKLRDSVNALIGKAIFIQHNSSQCSHVDISTIYWQRETVTCYVIVQYCLEEMYIPLQDFSF